MVEFEQCCDCLIPFVYETRLFGKPVKTTVICVCCGRKVSGRTFEKAVKKWNRRVGEANA